MLQITQECEKERKKTQSYVIAAKCQFELNTIVYFTISSQTHLLRSVFVIAKLNLIAVDRIRINNASFC